MNIKKARRIFADNFYRLMTAKGYESMKSFAKENNFSYQQICRFANGEHLPSLLTALDLSQALDCGIDDLMEGVHK